MECRISIPKHLLAAVEAEAKVERRTGPGQLARILEDRYENAAEVIDAMSRPEVRGRAAGREAMEHSQQGL